MSTHESLKTICKHNIGQQEFHLLPEKTLYWPAKATLVLGDLHLGKGAHFNKAGISIPHTQLELDNFSRLTALLKQYNPQRVFFLGDLFHSVHNSVWNEFVNFLKPWNNCAFTLIEGNHDILAADKYQAANLQVVHKWLEENILFTHEPQEFIPDHQYNLAGHLHPGVRLIGKGRQSLRLPCFFFGERQGILPAFGSFTGLMLMKPKKKDQVYVIYDNRVSRMT